ncbi:hypothetical protein Dda_4659 [Drechslerella dactyloides]|uniref:Uncharacterized protein n=1 Tax=Drechslerella dactyloides TaxID=74499 RepID=A0AAD6IXC1_DREDA|nr:hypothetical protein Dda_4659 [Drechslerella dactyloides]
MPAAWHRQHRHQTRLEDDEQSTAITHRLASKPAKARPAGRPANGTGVAQQQPGPSAALRFPSRDSAMAMDSD